MGWGEYLQIQNVNHHLIKILKFVYGNVDRPPQKKEQLTILKTFMKAFKISFEEEKSPYDPEFVKMIQQGDEDLKAGKGVKVDVDDLWK